MASKRKLAWIGLAIGVLALGAAGVDATFRNLGVVGTFNAVTGQFTGELKGQAPTINGDVLIWGSPAQIAALVATTISATAITNTSTVVGSPTGGNEGAGTINAQNIFVNGVSVSAAGLPINSLPAQTAEYDAHGNGFKNLLYIIANGIIQYTNNATNALLGFSINGTYNPVAYGVDPTGAADSTTAMEATDTAAVSAWPNGSGVAGPVHFPAGQFKHTSPLVVTGAVNSGTLAIEGDDYNGTQLIASGYVGPNVLVATNNLISSLNGGVITSAPLVTGSGASLFWNGAVPMWLDLSEDLGSLATSARSFAAYASGATALTVRVFFQPSATGRLQPIIASSGSVDYWSAVCTNNSNFGGGTTLCTGAFALWVDTDNKLHGEINTSGGGTQYVVSTGTVSTSVVNEGDLEFDGSHIGLALNGTWGSLVVATGTVVQRNDETTVIGTMMGAWPHEGINLFFRGAVYSPEIASIARQTLGSNYTQNTAAYTFDTHTIYGSYFDQTIDMPSPSSGHVLFGVDRFNGAASTTTWASIHNGGLGCCGGEYRFKNISFVGGTVGLDVANTNIIARDIGIYNQTYMGVNTSPLSSFYSFIDGVHGVPASSSMGKLVIEGGIASVKHEYSAACGILCEYINGGTLTDSGEAGQANTKWGVVIAAYGGVENVNLDNENGGTCSAVLLDQDQASGSATFNIGNSQLFACTTSGEPPIIFEGLNSGNAAITGNLIQWSGTPAAVVHEIGLAVGTFSFLGNHFQSGGSVPNIPLIDGANSNAAISGPPNKVLPNAGSPGTSHSHLTKIVAGQAVIAATTDTDGIIGIVPQNSGAGTTGYSIVQTGGTINCKFDSTAAPTAGDYVQISSTTAGDCLDSGVANTSTAPNTFIVGTVLVTGAASATEPVSLNLKSPLPSTLPATLFKGVGTPGIAGGGSLSAGSNSLAGQITSVAATANVLTPGFTCANAVVGTFQDDTTTGGVKVTAQNATTITFSATAADVVEYLVSCR